ncbi:MAG: stage II sporulation protein M [Saprospiraceae bacterium]|nr:stage II sporulation protein M [Lewinella sp.]
MRETNFIEQNQEKWKEFEGFLEGQHKRADKLNDLFVQITDDLSYSRTFYPNRSVRVYLNGLAQRVFINIYKHRKSRWGNILKFWTDELPGLMYEARRDLLLSFLVFLFTFGVGVLSSIYDSSFAEVILGEAYIEMTLTNIADGDPMRVYKEMGPMGMSMGITVNNLFVAFLTFVLGVFLSIGAMVMIARTGFMVGAFQYFFIERDLFLDSFLTIWTHGTLEISAIIIAGAAGATMGRGLVFPGTYTRTQAFQRSARRGIKMMVGTIPLFIIAGFIEGFLTRNTETPDFVRGIFILICLLVILVYFVWYPSVRAQVLRKKNIDGEELPPDNLLRIDFTGIKSTGTLFADSFLLFRSIFGKMIMVLLGLTTVYCLLAFGISNTSPQEMYYYAGDGFGVIQSIHPLLTGSEPSVMWIYNALAFATMAYFIFWQLQKMQGGDLRFTWAGLVSCLVGGILMSLILHLGNGWSMLLFITVFGVIMHWMYTCFQERIDPVTGIARSSKLLGAGYWQAMGLLLLTFCTGMIFATLADTGLGQFFFELVTWIINFDPGTMNNISVVMLTFLYIFLLYGVMSMMIASFGLFYHSRLEATEARTLRKLLQTFGENKQIRGMAKE